MSQTKIEWTDKTWNPVRGCSIISKGCTNCYAMKQAHRFSGKGQAYEGLTKLTQGGPVWTGKVRTVPEMLDAPLRWRKPSMVFVNSMSDLFHEDVPFEFIDIVFAVMAMCSQHIFQILTKRPYRMMVYMTSKNNDRADGRGDAVRRFGYKGPLEVLPWPLPNVWLGVSTENQQTADERIPLLLQTPAAVRWISAEPLLGPINFGRRHPEEIAQWIDAIDWIVVGGESGPGARPFDVQWARDIIRQCNAADVPVFMKQLGRVVIDRNDAGFDGCSHTAWPLRPDGCDPVVDFEPYGYVCQGQGDDCRIILTDRKGEDMAEWPEDLRVREWPT